MSSLFADHLLSWMIAVPFLGVAALALVRDRTWVRRTALAVTLVNTGLALVLWYRFDRDADGMQFVERVPWMPTFNIDYAVGVDGISLLLVLLTALLCPLCVLCSWSSITTKFRTFMIVLLGVEGALLAVFSALDLFLFFMAWEATMIPMYFLIILWGGRRRLAAGRKFVLYSLTGSLLLLVAVLGVYLEGGRTFDMLALAGRTYPADTQFWLFAAFFLSFAIKLPLPPFHTWLPDAYSEAPTAGSVILAGVLLKMGGYGVLRFCLPLFPDAAAAWAPFIIWWSVAVIVYGGYMALAQSDLKMLVAYSSVSHMGFVTLGIFVFTHQGLQGAVLHMFNHGVTTAALFLMVGQLYDRTHSRAIDDYGGLHVTMPRYAALLCLFAVASFGLPGTGNFIGEFLVLVGTSRVSMLAVLPAMGGIVLAAAYMLWMVQRVALGVPKTPTASRLRDITMRETATIAPLVALVFAVGLYPGPWMATMDAGVATLVRHMSDHVPVVSHVRRPE